MSRIPILVLSTTVTILGLVIVVQAASLTLRLAANKARLLSAVLLMIYGVVLISRPSTWPIIDIAVLLGAVGATVLLGGSLSSSGAVIALLVTAAVVDLFSVSGGLSRVIIDGYREGTHDFLLYLSLVAPIQDRIIPIVGISDLFLGGSAAVALIRLGLKPLWVIGTISFGFLAALVYGIWRGGAAALPFIAVVVLVLVWRSSIPFISRS